MMVIPDWLAWLEPFRLVGTLLLWVILPLQLWAIHRQVRQHQQWQESEAGRMERWRTDMDNAAKLRDNAAKLTDEAAHLRAQAEVALAQARLQVLSAAPRREEVE
jgi:biopolymer transport protein ExbB/TolQ